jgi:hypothetical protein
MHRLLPIPGLVCQLDIFSEKVFDSSDANLNSRKAKKRLSQEIETASSIVTRIKSYCVLLPVLTPKTAQIGQKLTRLVKTKIAASTNRIIPIVPETTLVKYNITANAASTIRIILSIVPTFGFIILFVLRLIIRLYRQNYVHAV